ncbi:MAG: hypothetical protein GY805_29540 [Chloroflexi bacterium]|nr:hypothetical protein [Chloroflexota bacterium]
MSSITYSGIVRQGKIELKDALAVPEGQQVYVVVPQIDEQAARRKANRWLLDNVGNMLMADLGSCNK